MQPDKNQYSIDYLNQIASEPKKPGLSNKHFMVIVGVLVLAGVFVGLLLLTGGASSTEKLERLTARLQALQEVSNKSQKNIKNGMLRSTNSNLSIFLTNANRDISIPLQNLGGDPKKLNKNIVKSESSDELIAKLEDARLNAVFDRTYAREMNYQLATVANLMKEIHTSTNSKSLKEFLINTDKNLQPIRQQLADFNATKS